LRGGDVLVVVPVHVLGAPAASTLIEPPRGHWRDVLRGDERSFDSREPVAGLAGEHGVGVFERL
jgi:hypothetical protein